MERCCCSGGVAGAGAGAGGAGALGCCAVLLVVHCCTVLCVFAGGCCNSGDWLALEPELVVQVCLAVGVLQVRLAVAVLQVCCSRTVMPDGCGGGGRWMALEHELVLQVGCLQAAACACGGCAEEMPAHMPPLLLVPSFKPFRLLLCCTACCTSPTPYKGSTVSPLTCNTPPTLVLQELHCLLHEPHSSSHAALRLVLPYFLCLPSSASFCSCLAGAAPPAA